MSHPSVRRPSRPRGPAPVPPSRWRWRLLLLGVVLSTVGACLVPARWARAEVVHQQGYEATVLGWTSWYGSYSLAGLGQAWCIDHGLRAPDAALGYAPTGPPGVPATTRTAMAWLVSTAGRAPSRLDAAAIMLVLHDLVGAIYPGGRLDLRHLTTAQLAGFDGQEAALLDRARALEADALAHGGLVGPLRLRVRLPAAPAAQRARRGGGPRCPTRSATRSAGWPSPSTATSPATRPPRSSPMQAGAPPSAVTGHSSVVRVAVTATAPDLALHVFGPSGAPAQRVVVPVQVALRADAALAPVPAVVRLLKVGDGTPAVGVGGARFTLRRLGSHGPGPVVAELVTGADGSTRTVTLVPGAYLVEETAPPPGYRGAGPWTVHLIGGTTRIIRLADPVARSAMRLQKVDAQTGRPLAGATLQLRADRDADGTFETTLPPITTTSAPIDLGNLLPGRYQLVELRAPAGYLRFPPQVVVLAPGSSVVVRLADPPAPPATSTTSTTLHAASHHRAAAHHLHHHLHAPAVHHLHHHVLHHHVLHHHVHRRPVHQHVRARRTPGAGPARGRRAARGAHGARAAPHRQQHHRPGAARGGHRLPRGEPRPHRPAASLTAADALPRLRAEQPPR